VRPKVFSSLLRLGARSREVPTLMAVPTFNILVLIVLELTSTLPLIVLL
jgi:hypothetical protein